METEVAEQRASDATIELTGFYPKQYYPDPLRLVRYWDEEQEREFVFLTNVIHTSTLLVVELYRNRWQIELFFQVAEATSSNQEVLGCNRERRTNSNLCCNMHLLSCGNRSTRYETGQKHRRDSLNINHLID